MATRDAVWMVAHWVGDQVPVREPAAIVPRGDMALVNALPYEGHWRIGRDRIWAELRAIQAELPPLGPIVGTWQELAAVALDNELDAEVALVATDDNAGPAIDEGVVVAPVAASSVVSTATPLLGLVQAAAPSDVAEEADSVASAHTFPSGASHRPEETL